MQDASSKQQTNKKTNPIIRRQDYHLTEPCPSEEKQTNKQKLSTNLTVYKGHTNHWTNLRRAETKRRIESNLLQGRTSTFLEAWEKETSKTVSKTIIIIMKRQRNTTQMKEQTRNTEVQINEEEIGKLPEEEFRIMIIKNKKS